ncbi:MAG: bacillithiol biosynthesis protein BshC [Gemmatimonadaceae bacterium]
MTLPRLITEPLGGSALARAAADGSAPAGWYARRPRGPNEWCTWSEAVRSAAPADWAARLTPAFVQRGAAERRLAHVVAQNGVLVTTGQQPGLFGGPIYTIAKALSALAIADVLEETTGVPTAPLFWAATDDSDVLEASATAIIADGAAVELRIPVRNHDARVPLSEVPLPNVNALIARLEAATGSASDARAIQLVRRAYREGVTYGAAFVELLAELLCPLGVTILDAGHVAVRQAAHPTLLRALDQAALIERALASRGDELQAAGFQPQVEQVPGRTLVFDNRGGKARVTMQQAGAVLDDARPGDLSPNVLLRPLVECAILPTIAYVAGPGELAYFAQTSAVARALNMRPVLALPRWSVTIVEPHVDRVLAEYGLSASALADLHGVQSQLAETRVPENVRRDLAALREAIDNHARTLGENVNGARNLGLREGVVEGARRSLHFRMDRLQRRVLAAAKRVDAERQHRVAAAAAALFPFGERQERRLNLTPFLARHGMQLLDAIRHEAGTQASELIAVPSHATS